MVAKALLMERKRAAGIVLGVSAVILTLLWLFADGFSTSVIEYLNAHGGYALILLYLSALVSGITAYVYRGHSVWAFAIVLLFALIASFVGMTIPLPIVEA